MNAVDEMPPPYLGDYADGAYWSAEPLASSDDATQAYAVSGHVVRFMWDHGVSVPLWDEEGLLPSEPEWLQAELGISEELIEALSLWGRDMISADGTAWNLRPTAERQQAYRELDVRARGLVEWLRRELASRYDVVYKPW
jgi:hypothetical protein